LTKSNLGRDKSFQLNAAWSALDWLELQFETLHVSNDLRRLRLIREVGYDESELDTAPRFAMGRTEQGNIWRFRHDLPTDLMLELDGLCRAQPVVATWQGEAQQAAAIRAGGLEPLYSTSWDNTASQSVARKIGAVQWIGGSRNPMRAFKHDAQRFGNRQHWPDCGLKRTARGVRIEGMTSPVLRPANFPADLEPMVAVLNAARPHHPRSVSELQHDLLNLEADLQPSFKVAELAGRIVGITEWQRNAGAYHPQRCSVELCVQPDAQGRGIGRLLWNALERELLQLAMLSVTVQVSEDHVWGLRFASERGFKEIKRDFESRLNVQSFDSGLFAALETALAERGVALRTWRELDSAAFRLELHEVFSVARLDVPRGVPATPISFSFFERNILEDAELLWDASFVALKAGHMVGFTGAYNGGAQGVSDQWLTAVIREARGQQIALALKVRQLEALRKLGFTAVRTDNDTRNAPMLAVNARLGFERQVAVLLLEKDFWLSS
jgi:mycothiol synthase